MSLLLGSVSHAIVYASTRPVAVVRGEMPAPEGGGEADLPTVAKARGRSRRLTPDEAFDRRRLSRARRHRAGLPPGRGVQLLGLIFAGKRHKGRQLAKTSRVCASSPCSSL
jgi:hypothetical protein